MNNTLQMLKTIPALFNLSLLVFWLPTASAESIVFPKDSGVVNVKLDPFNAKGDGVTDDTAAIRAAIDASKGFNKHLYFPNGIYLVSGPMEEGGTPHSHDRFLTYQGQSEAGAIIRLKDHADGFENPLNPKIVLSLYNGQGTGDAMHGYVRNLTIDVGVGNPGAIGLRYMSNNVGGMYHVTIRSSDPDGAGAIGLDMRQAQNGPNLVQNVKVVGFDYGVDTESSFSLVFEHLTLSHQRVVAFRNRARTTIRDLKSANRVPVIDNAGNASLTLIDGSFSGGDSNLPAILNASQKFFIRDAKQSGYAQLIKSSDGKLTGSNGVAEWYEGRADVLFGGSKVTSLRLPVKETPEIPWETDLSKWQKVDGNLQDDDTAAIQKAIDDAARDKKNTLYFAPGPYSISRPIRVHGSINRILGMQTIVNISNDGKAFSAERPVFTFDDLSSDTIVVERFFLLGGWHGPDYIPMFGNNNAKKTIVLRDMGLSGNIKTKGGKGTWFIDDVSPARNNTLYINKGEHCWARQWNPESFQANMIEVDGGDLWVLGLKTEGRASHLVATHSAKVEILGGISYQSWDKPPIDPPMITINNSSVSVVMDLYNHKYPFTTIVEETRSGSTKTLPRSQLLGNYIHLFRSAW